MINGEGPLDAVGVSAAAVQVYRAMLRRPGVSVDAALAGEDVPVTPDRLAVLIAELVRADLIEPAGDGGHRVRDPKVGIASLVRSRQEALEQVLLTASALAAEYAEGVTRREPHRLAEVVDGERAAVDMMMELVGLARHEVAVLDAPPYVDHGASAKAEQSLFDRNVRSRAIYATAALELPGRYDVIMAAIRSGERARSLPDVPIKMIVVDGERALLPLSVRDGRIGSVIVVHPSLLASALAALFESLWERAAPLHADAPAVPDDLDELDRALLALLGSGLKDEAMARQLGVSLRTLGRRITRLLDRLGATSRFQAGIQAARRGWV
ncbi:MAG: response regulator transcription factor [Hamadaea sp.]|nr:response regulator transcription factor [Hamadaea sp.]